MALIHEKLYHSDNFAEIDFEEYIRALCSALSPQETREKGIEEVFEEDPLGIAVPWEERYGEKKKS